MRPGDRGSMTITSEAIERALTDLEARIVATPRWTEEYRRERTRFSTRLADDVESDTSWRFREYFLLEHQADGLGMPPAVHLWDEVIGDDAAAQELAEAVIGSFTGIFEVTDAGDHMLRLVDLVTARELDLARTEHLIAAHEDDLIVGRAYPTSDGQFLSSPGIRILRELPVIDALRRDVERIRQERGEVAHHAHFSQIDLEKVLFQAAPSRRSATEIRADLIALLAAADMPADTLHELARAARNNDPVGPVMGPILERVAFDTHCDLDRAQIVLWEFWDVARSASIDPEPEPPKSLEGGAPSIPDDEACQPQRDRTEAALAAFEVGRAQGHDLDTLFRQLETDLGLEGTESEGPEDLEDPEDSLGVLSILAEYRWDRERQGDAPADRELEIVERFARFIDTSSLRPASIEDLGELHLRAFLVRELLPCQLSADDTEPREALARFLSWCDQEQSLDIAGTWQELEARHRSRLRRLRSLWNSRAEEVRPGPVQVEWIRLDHGNLETHGFEAERIAGREGDVIEVLPGLGYEGRLEPGDVLLCEIATGGLIVAVHEAFPREAEPLLRSDHWGVEALQWEAPEKN